MSAVGDGVASIVTRPDGVAAGSDWLGCWLLVLHYVSSVDTWKHAAARQAARCGSLTMTPVLKPDPCSPERSQSYFQNPACESYNYM